MNQAFEAVLGHGFKRPDLLKEALTHRSAAQGRGHASNERLEFIGDRVLGLIMAEWLAERFPREQEGELGRRLAFLVSQPVLAGVAETLAWRHRYRCLPAKRRRVLPSAPPSWPTRWGSPATGGPRNRRRRKRCSSSSTDPTRNQRPHYRSQCGIAPTGPVPCAKTHHPDRHTSARTITPSMADPVRHSGNAQVPRNGHASLNPCGVSKSAAR
jgi:hypothetical protein